MVKARVAQIGVGGFGGAIRRALVDAANVDYLAVCDVRDDILPEISATTGARIATATEIFADPEIQGVAIVVPNHLHRGYVEQAAAAGKHVFVEKPIANTTADGRAMIAACERAGVQLMVGHNLRRQPAYRLVKQWLDEGRLGRPITAHGEWSGPSGFTKDPASWRFDASLCPALPLIQLGIHLLDFCNHCFGQPVAVTAMQRHNAIPGDNIDTTTTLVEYDSGVLLTLVSNYCTPAVSKFSATGLDAIASVNGSTCELRRGQECQREELGVGESQLAEVTEWADAILGRATIETGGEAGLLALAVCEAATLSAAASRLVRIDELL